MQQAAYANANAVRSVICAKCIVKGSSHRPDESRKVSAMMITEAALVWAGKREQSRVGDGRNCAEVVGSNIVVGSSMVEVVEQDPMVEDAFPSVFKSTGRRIVIFLSGIGYRILPRRTDRISDTGYRISESEISMNSLCILMKSCWMELLS